MNTILILIYAQQQKNIHETGEIHMSKCKDSSRELRLVHLQ